MKSNGKRPALIVAAGLLVAAGIGQGIASADERSESKDQVTCDVTLLDSAEKLTASGSSFPVGTVMKVTNEQNGESVRVTIRERDESTCLAISSDAFARLGDGGEDEIEATLDAQQVTGRGNGIEAKPEEEEEPLENGIEELFENEREKQKEQELAPKCADGEILNDASECVPNESEPVKKEPENVPIPISCLDENNVSKGGEACPPEGTRV